MVKLFSTEHTFRHPFDRVTSAFWRKYPNEHAAHVKAVDITDRRIDDQGRLITTRLMSCESAVPAWLRGAGLPQSCYVAESSVVDPAAQKMVVKSSNLSGASLMVVEETCTYSSVPARVAATSAAAATVAPSPAPVTPASHTHYRQEARITAFLPFLSAKFEAYTLSNMTHKSREGMAVVERLCQRIQQEGVLSLLHPNTAKASL
jgi:hypothetical protein